MLHENSEMYLKKLKVHTNLINIIIRTKINNTFKDKLIVVHSPSQSRTIVSSSVHAGLAA